MRFEKLTQTIAAGGAWRLGMAAAELQIVSSSYPLRVTLYRGGAVIGSGSNVLAGDYFRGVDFDFVELFSDVAQDVSILLSDGESGSNRIVGEVSVINGEKSRSLGGVAFWGGTGISGVAAVYSGIQLWNPAASGRSLVVGQILVASDVAGSLMIASKVAAMVGLQGLALSKKIGGASSVAEIRYERVAALPAYPELISSMLAAPSTPLKIKFTEPIVIPPGYGLVAFSQTAATAIFANFEFYAETI